jgi:hypothetical protein
MIECKININHYIIRLTTIIIHNKVYNILYFIPQIINFEHIYIHIVIALILFPSKSYLY